MLAGFIAAIVAVILGAWRPSARGASPKDDSADDGRLKEADDRQLSWNRMTPRISDVTPAHGVCITTL
jgi:hypothetical protein